jgi:RimJ/RimL family protein N-acetyltransferase
MWRLCLITAEHVEGFHRCVDFAARERKYLAVLEAPPLDSTHQFVMNNITKGYSQFVAIFDNNVVGWCDVIPKNRSAHHSAVLGIGLLPACRGRGNGFALIDATINDARSRGIVRIEITVHADNARAIALYNKVAFKTEGLLKDAVLIDGQYNDLILMAIVDRFAARPPR